MAESCIFQSFVRRMLPRNAACPGSTSPPLVYPRANRSVPEPNPRVVPRRSVYPSLNPGLLFHSQGIIYIGRGETIAKLVAYTHQQFNETFSVVGLAEP